MELDQPDILRWGLANSVKISERAAEYAAMSGHWDLVLWIAEEGAPLSPYTIYHISTAAT